MKTAVFEKNDRFMKEKLHATLSNVVLYKGKKLWES